MNETQELPVKISTKRLTLRTYRFSDVPEMHAYLQDPDLGRFLEGSEARLSKADTEAVIARHILVKRDERSVWAICLGEQLIGAISLNFEKQRRIAEIGYHIKKPLWARGYATEAVRAVIATAFARCQTLQRIQAGIHPDNAGSIRVVERAGMMFEGTLRSYAFVGGSPADEAIYAVVRDQSMSADAIAGQAHD